MPPLIKKLALLVFILVAAYSSINYLIENIQAWNPVLITNDGVYDWDTRLSALRADLPENVKIVGYISDWDVVPKYNYPNNETEYVLTQYSMAPVVVTRGADRQWVIVNLAPKDFETWSATQPADIEVFQYPNGLFLVHRP
ncbi:MAG: hypothetical protein QM730_13365 [Anaerolineales bacterium]